MDRQTGFESLQEGMGRSRGCSLPGMCQAMGLPRHPAYLPRAAVMPPLAASPSLRWARREAGLQLMG